MSKYKDQLLQYENITFAQEKQSIMKREGVTEENHRLDNVSFWVSGGGGTAGVKQHSITMIVIPEEFLPPLEKEGGGLLFSLNHHHHRHHSYELASFNSIFGTGNNTMFKNEQ